MHRIRRPQRARGMEQAQRHREGSKSAVLGYLPKSRPQEFRWTRRRKQVFEFICNHLDEYGFPPSIREIGDEVGLGSSSSVSTHLDALILAGFISKKPCKPRSIRVLKRTIFGVPRGTGIDWSKGYGGS